MNRKKELTKQEHHELVVVMWVDLCRVYSEMGEQLKAFGLVLESYLNRKEDEQ